jgi:glycerol uptake facilitator-like aquaporin
MPLSRKLVVELIGTFFLVYTVCMAGAGALAPPAIGAVLMVMVFGGAAAAGVFLATQPAEEPEGDVEAART